MADMADSLASMILPRQLHALLNNNKLLTLLMRDEASRVLL